MTYTKGFITIELLIAISLFTLTALHHAQWIQQLTTHNTTLTQLETTLLNAQNQLEQAQAGITPTTATITYDKENNLATPTIPVTKTKSLSLTYPLATTKND